MNYGFIYCLGNQAMPGIYKIGMTERAQFQPGLVDEKEEELDW